MFQKISSEKVIGFPNGTINVFNFHFHLYKYKNISLSSRMSKKSTNLVTLSTQLLTFSIYQYPPLKYCFFLLIKTKNSSDL